MNEFKINHLIGNGNAGVMWVAIISMVMTGVGGIAMRNMPPFVPKEAMPRNSNSSTVSPKANISPNSINNALLCLW